MSVDSLRSAISAAPLTAALSLVAIGYALAWIRYSGRGDDV